LGRRPGGDDVMGCPVVVHLLWDRGPRGGVAMGCPVLLLVLLWGWGGGGVLCWAVAPEAMT